MVCACVDIGTNTTRVLVAEAERGRLTELRQERAFTRIGTGMTAGGAIAPAKIEEVASVVGRQTALARALGAEAVRVVATAAIRGAANRDEFCAAMGMEVCVLDGEDEARLAFLGATRTLGEELPGRVAVVDVGGGSTELAVGTVAGGVDRWASLPVGSGLLADRYLRSDPPSMPELELLFAHASTELEAVELGAPDRAVAVGGSAASLRAVVGDVLDGDALQRALHVLCGAPTGAVAERYGLDAERVRLLPAGIVILHAAARRLGQPLQIGRGGLREGVLLDLARTL
jgi:exopolyphosphatase / guanosine-5'-triphosphate,3'-diphosphate pyrophosphatase